MEHVQEKMVGPLAYSLLKALSAFSERNDMGPFFFKGGRAEQIREAGRCSGLVSSYNSYLIKPKDITSLGLGAAPIRELCNLRAGEGGGGPFFSEAILACKG